MKVVRGKLLCLQLTREYLYLKGLVSESALGCIIKLLKHNLSKWPKYVIYFSILKIIIKDLKRSDEEVEMKKEWVKVLRNMLKLEWWKIAKQHGFCKRSIFSFLKLNWKQGEKPCIFPTSCRHWLKFFLSCLRHFQKKLDKKFK